MKHPLSAPSPGHNEYAMTRHRKTTLTDRAIRMVLIIAYRGQRLVWRFHRPTHRGVAVAVWYGDSVLMVRHSYHPGTPCPAAGCGAMRRPRPVPAGICWRSSGFTYSLPIWP